jgi:hypothetical protein
MRKLTIAKTNKMMPHSQPSKVSQRVKNKAKGRRTARIQRNHHHVWHAERLTDGGDIRISILRHLHALINMLSRKKPRRKSRKNSKRMRTSRGYIKRYKKRQGKAEGDTNTNRKCSLSVGFACIAYYGLTAYHEESYSTMILPLCDS